MDLHRRSKDASGLYLDGIENVTSCISRILLGWNREDAPVRLAEPQSKPMQSFPPKARLSPGVRVRRSWQKHLLTR
jgi:hypothetical protein